MFRPSVSQRKTPTFFCPEQTFFHQKGDRKYLTSFSQDTWPRSSKLAYLWQHTPKQRAIAPTASPWWARSRHGRGGRPCSHLWPLLPKDPDSHVYNVTSCPFPSWPELFIPSPQKSVGVSPMISGGFDSLWHPMLPCQDKAYVWFLILHCKSVHGGREARI